MESDTDAALIVLETAEDVAAHGTFVSGRFRLLPGRYRLARSVRFPSAIGVGRAVPWRSSDPIFMMAGYSLGGDFPNALPPGEVVVSHDSVTGTPDQEAIFAEAVASQEHCHGCACSTLARMREAHQPAPA